MSIFNRVNSEERKVTSLPIMGSFDLESAVFNMMNDIIVEGYNVSMQFNKSMCTGLYYNDYEIIKESFTDFFKSAADFFKMLIQKIKEFFENAMRLLLSYIQDFKTFLDKNGDYIRTLDVDFDFEGYEFTLNKTTSPNITMISDIVTEFNNNNIARIASLKYSEVCDLRDKFESEQTKDIIRGKILNNGEVGIPEQNFDEQSKLTFRKTNEPVTLSIDKAYVSNIINEYGDLKKLLDNTKKEKERISGIYHDLEYYFSKKAYVVYEKAERSIKAYSLEYGDRSVKKSEETNMNYSDSGIKTLNLLFDYNFKKSRMMCNYTMRVFTDKINAIKDCMKQYRDIIRRTLHENKNVKNNKKEDKSNDDKED